MNGEYLRDSEGEGLDEEEEEEEEEEEDETQSIRLSGSYRLRFHL